jgi:hypothetical protein
VQVSSGARRLLAGTPGESESSKQLAERAAAACEQFAQHLSRLLGATAVDLLVQRSVVLASATLPWLAPPSSRRPVGAVTTTGALRAAMEREDPAAISEAFATILSELVGLLGRLIGEGLVDRLLHEVWPTVFVAEVKDIP